MVNVEGIFVSDGGVPKLSIDQVNVTINGLDGDRQRDLKHHGGPDRAVCVLQTELLSQLQSEGHPIQPGTTGENLLISGIDLEIGTQFTVDEVQLEVVSDAPPCKTIASSFTNGEFKRISYKLTGQTRWYCRVIKPGIIRISA